MNVMAPWESKSCLSTKISVRLHGYRHPPHSFPGRGNTHVFTGRTLCSYRKKTGKIRSGKDSHRERQRDAHRELDSHSTDPIHINSLWVRSGKDSHQEKKRDAHRERIHSLRIRSGKDSHWERSQRHAHREQNKKDLHL